MHSELLGKGQKDESFLMLMIKQWQSADQVKLTIGTDYTHMHVQLSVWCGLVGPQLVNCCIMYMHKLRVHWCVEKCSFPNFICVGTGFDEFVHVVPLGICNTAEKDVFPSTCTQIGHGM